MQAGQALPSGSPLPLGEGLGATPPASVMIAPARHHVNVPPRATERRSAKSACKLCVDCAGWLYAPRQINSGASATAIFPWSVAGGAGKLDVVWYGTSYYDGTNPPDSYPASAAWYVYFAQNLSATSGGSFSQTQATPIVHYGGVCEGGISCTGNRDLYDRR